MLMPLPVRSSTTGEASSPPSPPPPSLLLPSLLLPSLPMSGGVPGGGGAIGDTSGGEAKSGTSPTVPPSSGRLTCGAWEGAGSVLSPAWPGRPLAGQSLVPNCWSLFGLTRLLNHEKAVETPFSTVLTALETPLVTSLVNCCTPFQMLLAVSEALLTKSVANC